MPPARRSKSRSFAAVATVLLCTIVVVIFMKAGNNVGLRVANTAVNPRFASSPQQLKMMPKPIMRHMGHSGARAMHDEFEGVAPLRRQILQGGMMLGLLCGPKISKADEIVDTVEPSLLKPAVNAQYESLNDPILSYSYKVPQKTESGMALNLVTTRKPEKYSSAAPLSSNFRHRIVNSKLDFNKAIVVCMYVNPAVGILKKFPPSDWTSQQVADTILLDRLNAKSIEEGRRYLDQNVEGGDKYQDEDGTFYFVYEHLEPGKIISTATPEGRHNLAVTAARPGLDGSLYLYSLNMGCPETIWEDLKPSFYEAAKSFRIDALGRTSSEYIPPDKDPWKIL